MKPRPRLIAGLTELRRRHVFRVLAAYAVVAWVFIEIATTTLPLFRVPDWVLTAIVTLAALGLPLAAILAWAYDLTPHGIERTPPATPEHAPVRSLAEATDAVAPVPAPPPRYAPSNAIAVLPFADLSGDPANEYFSDGITDDILMLLSKIAGLRVISRTSAVRYKRTTLTLPEIAAELNVGTVLEGSVRRAGDSVRIVAQLIDARTDEHIWAEAYDRTVGDIFAVQMDVAARIAAALRRELSAEERARIHYQPTHDLAAYELYLRGRECWNRRTREELVRAESFFRRATERDPAFALAYAGLADAYLLQGSYGVRPAAEARARARSAAERALALDASIAEAHATLGRESLEGPVDWARAEACVRRALEFGPGYATGHHWYALYLSLRGRTAEALAEMRTAAEMDPFSPAIVGSEGTLLLFAGAIDEAVERLRAAVALGPSNVSARVLLARALSVQGHHDEALAALSTAAHGDAEPRVLAETVIVHAHAGDRIGAHAVLARLVQPHRAPSDPLAVAMASAALDQRDTAIDWLEQVQWDAKALLHLLADPVLQPVRSDPRYLQLVARLGLDCIPPATPTPEPTILLGTQKRTAS